MGIGQGWSNVALGCHHHIKDLEFGGHERGPILMGGGYREAWKMQGLAE